MAADGMDGPHVITLIPAFDCFNSVRRFTLDASFSWRCFASCRLFNVNESTRPGRVVGVLSIDRDRLSEAEEEDDDGDNEKDDNDNDADDDDVAASNCFACPPTSSSSLARSSLSVDEDLER